MVLTEEIYRVQLQADLDDDGEEYHLPELDLDEDSEAMEAAQFDIEQELLKERQDGKD